MSTATLSPQLAAIVKHIHKQDPNMGWLKLQKILYYVQGYSLAWTGQRPFPETPEAWRNGPVYPVVRSDAQAAYPQARNADVSILSENTIAIVDAVLNRFRDYTGQKLADRTHHEMPWVRARAGIPAQAASREPLSEQDMLEFFLTQESQQSMDLPDLTQEWQMPSEEFLAAERRRWAVTLDILGQ